MHETLNVDDWKSFYHKYTSEYVEGANGRFLLKRSRLAGDLSPFLNDLARVYKTAQRQYKKWRDSEWYPLLNKIQSLAESNENSIKLHCCPTHEYTGKKQWYAYCYDLSSVGWGYSYNWVDEPEEKLHHDLGQKLYELDNYQKKFRTREYVLKSLLGWYLIAHVYHNFDDEWLAKNQFSGKLVKINLKGDEYWYRIEHDRNGFPVWMNFIWQSNETTVINL